MQHVSTVLLDALLMEDIGRAKNDRNYFGEINGSVWGNNCQENGRHKSGESSGLFIDSACWSVSRWGWKVELLLSAAAFAFSFNQRCSSPESHFNYCRFLLIIFMTSHISLFIHQQCLQLLFEYVGFSLFLP